MSTVPHTLEPVHFSPQTIYCGDCLEILAHFPPNSVDLIYIDPPFNSNRNYEMFWGDTQEKRAFDDRYGDAMAYCAYMRPRVEQLHRVLKSTGSFYYHCDWHASHYIKVMLDEVFGANFFRNEIVWHRTTAKSQTFKGFPNNHDSIFTYSKTAKFSFNRQFTPHSAERIRQHYSNVEAETGRKYSLGDLTAEGTRNGSSGMPWRGIDIRAKGNHWKYTIENLEELDKSGRIYWPAKQGGMPRLKRYLDEQEGVAIDTVWTDINPINSQAAEKLGYPTQKPLALLERIIRASSNPGDIVLDAFCGCGTALVAAQQLGRKWLGIDISPTSANVMGQRLEKDCGLRLAPPSMSAREVEESWDKTPEGAGASARPGAGAGAGPFYRFSNLPRSAEQLRKLPGFEFENWAVLQLGEVLRGGGHAAYAQTNRSKVGDLGLDGRIYLADKVSLPVTSGDLPLMAASGISGERQSYLPIQVKNTDKVGRPEIDKFAHALQRDGRHKGFFIGWEFSRDAEKEIDRLRRLPEAEARVIFPVPVRKLIAEDFGRELLGLLQ